MLRGTSSTQSSRASPRVPQTKRARPCSPTSISFNDSIRGKLAFAHSSADVLTDDPPSGECAEHFRSIIDKFPPQVSSRSAAVGWGCHVHNEVNKSLKKPIFDCSKIGDYYDCGCAADEDETAAEKTAAEKTAADYKDRKVLSG